MALTITDLKAHSNITGTADDAVLTRLLTSAQRHVERLLGFTFEAAAESDPPRDGFDDGVPPDLEQAVLMLAAGWYENREDSISGMNIAPLPIGVAEIIAEHRDYTFGMPCDG